MAMSGKGAGFESTMSRREAAAILGIRDFAKLDWIATEVDTRGALPTIAPVL